LPNIQKYSSSRNPNPIHEKIEATKRITLKRILIPNQNSINSSDINDSKEDNRISLLTGDSIHDNITLGYPVLSNRKSSNRWLLSSIYRQFEGSDTFMEFQNITRAAEAEADETINVTTTNNHNQTDQSLPTFIEKKFEQKLNKKSGRKLLDNLANGSMDKIKKQVNNKYRELNEISKFIHATVQTALIKIENEPSLVRSIKY